ncbi:MAG: HAD hydrolase-like protein, partial [Thermodesulfobacteriota bacterium]
VDVSGSYREAVRQTARLFFNGIISGKDLPDPLFSLTDLAGVKQAGGLNNDWELTYHVLTLLMTQIETPPESPHREGWACHENLMPRCDVKELSAYLKSSVTPLADLEKQHSDKTDSWIEYLSTGDVGTGNIIKQIFQELYLGGDLFRQTYGFAPRIHDRKGLIDREALLIPASTIKRLAETHRLALATGRPRSEAEHALNRFNLQTHFKITYTLDECLTEEEKVYEKSGEVLHLSKPHPFMLDAIVQNCSEKLRGFYYVGDMPDDMMAAANSTHAFKGVGILHSSPHKQSLKQRLVQAGADIILEDADELMNYFS